MLLALRVSKARNNSDATDLDEWGAAEEETKHVGHDVITDHAGNWHNEPVDMRKIYMRPTENSFNKN